MKRLSVLLLCLTIGAASFAQENEHSFLVVPRLEANPYIGGNQTFDLGNSSLYTLFEGELGEHFSYSVMNHWLSSDPGALYANTLRSDDSNWLDWAYLTAYVGNFDISLGKQVIMLGSLEQDDYDYDVCFTQGSTVLNNLHTYNWGLSLGYTNDEENTYLAAQVTTSPFGEYNNSGLFSYSLFWSGEYEFFNPLWSVNVMDCYDNFSPDSKSQIYMFSLGNLFSFDDVEFYIDWVARSYSPKHILTEEMSFIGAIKYYINDQFDVMLKGGWEFNRSGKDVIGYVEEDEFGLPDLSGFVPTSLALMDKDYLFGGLLLNYYPLEDSQDLRLHAALAANNFSNSFSVSLGATYYLDLFDFLQQ